jgi:hypothetical protein
VARPRIELLVVDSDSFVKDFFTNCANGAPKLAADPGKIFLHRLATGQKAGGSFRRKENPQNKNAVFEMPRI